jgi:hypothetical protein
MKAAQPEGKMMNENFESRSRGIYETKANLDFAWQEKYMPDVVGGRGVLATSISRFWDAKPHGNTCKYKYYSQKRYQTQPNQHEQYALGGV